MAWRSDYRSIHVSETRWNNLQEFPSGWGWWHDNYPHYAQMPVSRRDCGFRFRIIWEG